MRKAVILARGLGKRMRKESGSGLLSREQAAVADTGVKALIPVGRPFLDYVIGALADAGYGNVCLVIGPEHDAVREYYGSLKCERIRIEFAVQEKPLGTADAVAASEEFAAGEPFLAINSDNYYPIEVLRALREMKGCGLAAFEKEGLLQGSNIPPERIARFAVVEIENGCLRRIIEKPSEDVLKNMPAPICVSMNCWRFDEAIFRACRAVPASPRGEFEITDAVQYAIDRLGRRFAAPAFKASVLDLTSREDVADVAKRLSDVRIRL
jgi:glucose-1-phosphate thymidylyltransferase